MINRSGINEMSEPMANIISSDRFNWFEYSNDDFPFYNGIPTKISGLQWLFVIAMVVIGFLSLIVPIPFFARGIGQYIPAILFFAIPLAGLAIVTPKYWKAIFRQVRGRDIMWMVVFGILNMIVTMGIGWVVSRVTATTANPGVAGLSNMGTSERVLFFLKTIPQLFGEEVLTVLPFLALLYFFFSRMKLSRNTTIALAWLLSAVLFGAVHLPTYGWNLVQCLVVIGSARLILLLAYIKTKNIWVSTGAHIINDWTFFGLILAGIGIR